ncbi:thiol-disulfide oxidoreductase DCC family protein [Planctomycetaceae bacterium SH139]
MNPGHALADPDTNPGRDVVIYDGHCQFCTAGVRRLASLDKWSSVFGRPLRLSFISLHDSRVQNRYSDLSYDQLMEQMYVIDRQNRRHGGADAVRYLSRRLPLLWPVVPILHFPGTARLWRWLYQQFARQRYRWNRDSCENGTCAVHFGDAHRKGNS